MTTPPHAAFRASAQQSDAWKDSITRDLEALLNTRSALLPDALAGYPAGQRFRRELRPDRFRRHVHDQRHRPEAHLHRRPAGDRTPRTAAAHGDGHAAAAQRGDQPGRFRHHRPIEKCAGEPKRCNSTPSSSPRCSAIRSSAYATPFSAAPWTNCLRNTSASSSTCGSCAATMPSAIRKSRPSCRLGGDACDDPHVERLIQSVALLCARVSKRLDDSLSAIHRGAAQPAVSALSASRFPRARSCAFSPSSPADGARPSRAGPCWNRRRSAACIARFQTAYDVAPARSRSPPPGSMPSIQRAVIDQAGRRHGLGRSASISSAIGPMAAAVPRLRIYLDGDASFCAALRDALFMRTASRLPPGGRRWRLAAARRDTDRTGRLRRRGRPDPVRRPFARAPTGFLPSTSPFPEKFNFVDIDLAALGALLPAGLHAASRCIWRWQASRPARTRQACSPACRRTACWPAARRSSTCSSKPGVPIAYSQRTAEYSVLAHAAQAAAYEVLFGRPGPHGPATGQGLFGASNSVPSIRCAMAKPMRTRAATGSCATTTRWPVASPGHEKVISLVDADGDTAAVEQSALSIDLTCTNRDLPCLLKCGAAGGDLSIPGAAQGATIRFLRRPTRPYRLANGHGRALAPDFASDAQSPFAGRAKARTACAKCWPCTT